MNIRPRLEAAADFADRTLEKLDHELASAKAALAKNDSLPARAVLAAAEIPNAMKWGALGGVAVVALPSVLAPPLAPFFLPWTPVAAVWGASIGFAHGLGNAAGRLIDGNEFKPTFPPG